MAVLALLPSSLDSTALLASMGFQLRGPLSFSLIIGRLSGNSALAYALYRRPTVPSGPCPFQAARTLECPGTTRSHGRLFADKNEESRILKDVAFEVARRLASA